MNPDERTRSCSPAGAAIGPSHPSELRKADPRARTAPAHRRHVDVALPAHRSLTFEVVLVHRPGGCLPTGGITFGPTPRLIVRSHRVEGTLPAPDVGIAFHAATALDEC